MVYRNLSLMLVYLGNFQYFEMTCISVMDKPVHMYFHIAAGSSSECIPRRGIAGSKDKCKCPFIELSPFSSHTQSRSVPFPTASSTEGTVRLLIFATLIDAKLYFTRVCFSFFLSFYEWNCTSFICGKALLLFCKLFTVFCSSFKNRNIKVLPSIVKSSLYIRLLMT